MRFKMYATQLKSVFEDGAQVLTFTYKYTNNAFD